MIHCAELDPSNAADSSKWDRFAENHPYGWLCHLWSWKRIIEHEFPHIRGRYAVVCEGTDIVAGMPLYELNSIYAGKRLISIPFATLSDPLVTTSDHLKLLMDYAVGLKKALACNHLEIRTRESAHLMRGLGYRSCDTYQHHFLQLGAKPEALLKTFDRSCVRQRISRATKSGLTLRIAQSDQDIEHFYRLYALTRRRLGLPPFPRRFITSMSQLLGSKGRAKTLLAMHDGAPVAGLMVLKFRDRVSAEILCYDEAALRISPNHFLFWEAIKEACAEGYKVFDFGRTARNNTSLMDFKGRWGTQVIDLPIFYLPEARSTLSAVEHEPCYYKLVKSAIQHLPVPLLEKCGALLYRHRA